MKRFISVITGSVGCSCSMFSPITNGEVLQQAYCKHCGHKKSCHKFTNLVFAKSQGELDKKLGVLKQMRQLSCNYNKLTGELHPMAYWQGDTCHDVLLTEMGDK